MNTNLIKNFEALAKKEKASQSPNIFKIKSYISVAKILSQLTFEITHSSQVKDIPRIGQKTLEKIDEFLEFGKIKALENFQPIDDKQTVSQTQLLEGVTGIGPVKAKKLAEEGYTLQQLRDMYNKNDKAIIDLLTSHQLLGIKYYDELSKRIPFDEITKVNTYLQNIVETVNNKHFTSKQFKFQICGSYRRQSPNSGDIDILFYNTLSNEDDEKFFLEIMRTLNSKKFLKDHLTDPEKVTTKYMGFCRLPRKKVCRRIDMRCIKYSSLPAALLYFTGSGDFNKNMRKFALKKGYTINEYGIYKLNENREKGPLVPVKTEEDIFKVLGLEYIEPKDRLSTVIFK